MARIWHQTFSSYIFSHRKLWLFPLLAGSFWFITLTTLLIRWLALGRPRYPEQVNPDVPFISDIAAATLKPVFIVGCAATAVCFFGTVFAVNHVRYSPDFYRLTDDRPWRQMTSLLALVAGLAASASLFLLSIFDTVDATRKHRYFLMSTFLGLWLSALLTTVVWWDQLWQTGPIIFVGLRRWYVVRPYSFPCILPRIQF